MANIKTHLNNIKGALYGKDVRGSIHDGIDAINKEVENTTGRQVDLENTFDQLVINAGNSNAEIVDARVKSDGTSYSKLGDRLNEVDSQLAHIKNEGVIYIDEFEGTDTEKLQQAYDKASSSGDYNTIIINREIFIDSPIYNNKESNYKYFKILGQGGTINIQFDGYLFDCKFANNHRHIPMFQNIWFKSTGDYNSCVVNGDKYIRGIFDSCQFSNVSCIHTNGYIQTLRIHNCEINNLKSNFIDASMAYDCVVSECRFEQHQSIYKAINIQEKVKGMGISYLSLRIVNNLFEGYYNSTAINLGTGYGLLINGNYFEANNENITFTLGHGINRTSGDITSNIFNSTKNSEKTSIKFNDIVTTYLKIESNTTNDDYLADKSYYKNVYDDNNNLYANGKDFKVEGVVIKPSKIGNYKCVIKEHPTKPGQVIFKFPTPYYGDFHNNVTGTYLISVEFGYGSSSQYRGSASILVSTGSAWVDGKMQKMLDYKVLSGVSTYATNGYNGNNFEKVKVYWDETMQTVTTSNAIRFITVEIENTSIQFIDKCFGAMTNIRTLIGDIISNY